MIVFINPTGQGIRSDREGLGHYGASRGDRKHDGVDFSCVPDQSIYMPVNGIIVRESLPYKDDLRWTGVYIIAPRIEIKMWYLKPFTDLFGRELEAGTVIGHAQNIGEKYKGVNAHIHLRIVSIDPMLFFSALNEKGDFGNIEI